MDSNKTININNDINNNINFKNYYKNINEPLIESCVNNFNLKNLLELSTITDLSVFTKKKKNEWKLKEKRILLKECDSKRKQKIKEVHDHLNILSKNKSKEIMTNIKNKNNNLLDDIENIDTLIEIIEKDYPNSNKNTFLEKFSN